MRCYHGSMVIFYLSREEGSGHNSSALWDIARQVHGRRRCETQALLDDRLKVRKPAQIGVGGRSLVRAVHSIGKRAAELLDESFVHVRMCEDMVERVAQCRGGRVAAGNTFFSCVSNAITSGGSCFPRAGMLSLTCWKMLPSSSQWHRASHQ